MPPTPAPSGPVACLAVKPAGKPDAGNRHVRFDERGWETGRWPKPKPPRPSSTLPVRKWCVRRSSRDHDDCVRSSRRLQNLIGGSIGRSLISKEGWYQRNVSPKSAPGIVWRGSSGLTQMGENPFVPGLRSATSKFISFELLERGILRCHAQRCAIRQSFFLLSQRLFWS